MPRQSRHFVSDLVVVLEHAHPCVLHRQRYRTRPVMSPFDREASRKWTMSIRNWKQALNHFAIMCEGCIPEANSK